MKKIRREKILKPLRNYYEKSTFNFWRETSFQAINRKIWRQIYLSSRWRRKTFKKDLDSIGDETLSYVKDKNIKIKKFPAKKDLTDTALCIDYLLEEGYKDLVILGALGTRLDHELANLYNLKRLYKLGVKAKIVDDYNEVIYVEEGEYEFERSDKKYFSLINAGDKMSFTTEGLYYEVQDLEINAMNPSRAVSNVMLGDKAKVIINYGSAFIIRSRD